MENIEIFKLNDKSLSDRTLLNRIYFESEIDKLIELAIDFKNAIESKKPFYYRLSKSGCRVSLFNELGNLINVDVDVNTLDLSNLTSVKTHKQFSFASYDNGKKYNLLLLQIARRMGLPVFKNGNFKSKTKIEFIKLGLL